MKNEPWLIRVAIVCPDGDKFRSKVYLYERDFVASADSPRELLSKKAVWLAEATAKRVRCL